MTKKAAENRREYTQVSALCESTRLRAAFARTERDKGGALVLRRNPKPNLPHQDARRLENKAAFRAIIDRCDARQLRAVQAVMDRILGENR